MRIAVSGQGPLRGRGIVAFGPSRANSCPKMIHRLQVLSAARRAFARIFHSGNRRAIGPSNVWLSVQVRLMLRRGVVHSIVTTPNTRTWSHDLSHDRSCQRATKFSSAMFFGGRVCSRCRSRFIAHHLMAPTKMTRPCAGRGPTTSRKTIRRSGENPSLRRDQNRPA